MSYVLCTVAYRTSVRAIIDCRIGIDFVWCHISFFCRTNSRCQVIKTAANALLANPLTLTLIKIIAGSTDKESWLCVTVDKGFEKWKTLD